MNVGPLKTMRCRFIAGGLLLCSCAPIVISDQVHETTIATHVNRSRVPGSERTAVDIQPLTNSSGLLLSAHRSESCKEDHVADVVRTRDVTRSPDWNRTTNLGVASALGFGLGSWVLADAHNVPEAGDPNTRNPVGRIGAKAIGVGLLVAGGVALAGGIATILRGSDLRENLGKNKYLQQTTIVACNEGPAPKVSVDLVSADGELPEASSFMGETASNGQLRIPKDAFRPFFNFLPERERAQVRVGSTLADVDLRGIRAELASGSVASALSLARNDQVEEAEVALRFAAQLGADVVSAQAALDEAPSRRRQIAEAKRKADAERAAAEKEKEKGIASHLAQARQYIRAGKLEKAQDELYAASALGGDVAALTEKVERTIVTRSVARWKEHVARCRKVSTIRSKIENLPHCDDDCQVVKRRVERDWERLGQEALFLDGIPAEQSQGIMDMCQRAGCPDCPK